LEEQIHPFRGSCLILGSYLKGGGKPTLFDVMKQSLGAQPHPQVWP
jgi:hypothetical protein